MCVLNTHYLQFTLFCSATDGMEVRSVGNSQTLKDTAFIEAFNLKAAIEYTMKNIDAAREALTDMPPRAESELDPVSTYSISNKITPALGSVLFSIGRRVKHSYFYTVFCIVSGDTP